MKKVRYCGLNLCSETTDEVAVLEFHATEIPENSRIFANPRYELIVQGNRLTTRSSLLPERSLEFDHEILDVCSNPDECFILLSDRSLHSYDFCEDLKPTKVSADEKLVMICCTASSALCITVDNSLIKISNSVLERLFQFPKHQKIRNMCAGAEHCLILTTNGDILSFGCGLRGVLGHGDVSPQDSPKVIEALAGLKIIDIACGLFHSVAVSSFGDVYTFGWNTHGQLGMATTGRHTFKDAFKSHQQVFTSPMLIDFEEDILVSKAYCGSKHTILRTESNRIFAAGLNSYGQLGLGSKENVSKFTEIAVRDVEDTTEIVCGYWTTYFIDAARCDNIRL